MALIKILFLLAMCAGNSQSGYAPRYSKGLMERVAHNRKMTLVDCMISSPTLPLGTWVYVYGKNTDTTLYCRVTDVSAPKDRARHIKTKRVVELGYTEALRLCGKSAMNKRPEQCPVIVTIPDKCKEGSHGTKESKPQIHMERRGF